MDRVEELAELEKQPLHSNNHPLFEWLPGSEIEVGDHENFFDIQDEILMNINNDLIEEQDVDANQNEDVIIDEINENLVTDTETITDIDESDSENDENDAGCEDYDHFSYDHFSKRVDKIMNDINTSSYDDDDVKSDDYSMDEIIDDASSINSEESDETVVRRTTRSNAGTGVVRLSPNMEGKSHDDVLKNIQLLMTEKLKEHEKEVDARDALKLAVNVMFTQMQATLSFKLFGAKSVAAMVKELKQLESGPMPGKKVIMTINPDELTKEQKNQH